MKPSRVGAAGSEAVPPHCTACASGAGVPPAASKATWSTAGSQWAVSVRVSRIAVEKSNALLEPGAYQPANVKPSRVGAAGSEAVPPHATHCMPGV